MDVEATKLIQGQPEIWELMLSFMQSMALKCVVELGIPDILNSHDRPLSLAEIASNITNSSSPNIPFLFGIMSLLVHKKIFTTSTYLGGGDSPSAATLYGPTSASRWLVRDNNEWNLAPLVLMQNHPLLLGAWHQLSASIREGRSVTQKAYGCEIWELAAQNPEVNKCFNEGMASTGKITMKAILSGLNKDAWDGLESVVDVGGGTGETIAEIVKTYPRIKGINFDLPHVVATAPGHIGVSHVGGDMFEAIPSAQAVFMKVLSFFKKERSVNGLCGPS